MREIRYLTGLVVQLAIGFSLGLFFVDSHHSPSSCGAVIGGACSALYFIGFFIGRAEP